MMRELIDITAKFALLCTYMYITWMSMNTMWELIIASTNIADVVSAIFIDLVWMVMLGLGGLFVIAILIEPTDKQ